MTQPLGKSPTPVCHRTRAPPRAVSCDRPLATDRLRAQRARESGVYAYGIAVWLAVEIERAREACAWRVVCVPVPQYFLLSTPRSIQGIRDSYETPNVTLGDLLVHGTTS